MSTSVALSKPSAVVASAIAASIGSLMFAPNAAAFTINGISVTTSPDCPTSICVKLQDVYSNVTGGSVSDPSSNLKNEYLTPGSNTGGDASSVVSYSYTGSNTNGKINGGENPITVGSLDNLFEMYWGSVDSYNLVEFLSGNSVVASISGSDLATALGWGSPNGAGNYNQDIYVKFAGDRKQFDGVKISSSKESTEVAVAASTPEPATLMMVGSAAMMSFFVKRRRSV